MSYRHLSDDQLIDTCLGVSTSGVQEHLLACPTCETRRAAVGQMLMDVTDVATAQADAIFTPERLTRQHARILQRVDQDGRPARVIVFPAGQAPAATVLHSRPAMRWVSAAAAAGLVLGLLGGHLARNLTGFDPAPAQQPVLSQAAATAAVRTVAISAVSAEDEFLEQIELATGSAGPAVLRPIDALTPRAWEVR